jgi:hypothetical protein
MILHRKPKLPILYWNSEEKQKIQQYSKEHLHELSIELASEYIQVVIIPSIVQDRYALTPEERCEETVKGLFSDFDLKNKCPSTIYKWPKLIGFKYEPQRKSYYADGHKLPELINNRKNICKVTWHRKDACTIGSKYLKKRLYT